MYMYIDQLITIVASSKYMATNGYIGIVSAIR